ncbi:hypothetical protein [Microcoleus sp. D3_18a_C4]|uniref:hypothetical protein n=1 Tax=Microcoleus sp. D3_18a_C4 TaxID=3055332 RepID=UPI002FD46ABE
MATTNANVTDPYELARKYARHGAAVWRIKIDGQFVSKCFLQRCPKCFKKLPGMLSDDGWECCVERKCDYKRVIYTESELRGLGKKG